MIDNEDPKVELQNFRALLAARLIEEREQVRRFRQIARDRDDRVAMLTARIIEIDAAIAAIDIRRP